MIQNTSDPLKFLNIKKKRQSNKQRGNISTNIIKQKPNEEINPFILPSFSSLNSLEHEQSNKINKTYNLSKYFNPEVEEYLKKLEKIKIANSPVMREIPKYNNGFKIVKEYNKLDEKQTIPMMTFAKAPDFDNIPHPNNEIKTAFNFYKPGLKKSGSMKMMQKMGQTYTQNIQAIEGNKQGISPWELPENYGQQQQLKQCQICSRKFNPKSYEKHVKVCEKVFFQKRKPFSSRSNSLDNKSTTK